MLDNTMFIVRPLNSS